MHAFLVILYTCVVFIAMMVNLAVRPKLGAKMTGFFVTAAVFLGFIFYGYGYAHTIPDIPMAVLRATMSVWFMFVGRNDLSSVSSAPLFQTKAGLFLFWLTHLIAIYAFASATFITIGAGAIRFLRFLRSGFQPVSIIYGVNASSVSFGRELAKEKRLVLLVDGEKEAEPFEDDIRQSGGILCSDLPARNVEKSFLRSIGLSAGTKKFDLYCLHESAFENLKYAQTFLAAAQERNVFPQQMRLVIAVEEAMAGDLLQAQEGRYGYGEVYVFSPGDMAARLMMRSFPPAGTLAFDETGRAKQDFEALIIGFGSTAQCVLRELIMHGQFEGSAMHVTVCDRNLTEIGGSFIHREKTLLTEYDIRFMEHDARSKALYDYIEERGASLNYVVVSTGDSKQDQEISMDLMQYLYELGSAARVIVCSRVGVSFVDKETIRWTTLNPYTTQILCDEHLDEQAKAINQAYSGGNGRSVNQNWRELGYFSRMSCRAAADFLPAYLAALEESGVKIRDGCPDGDPVTETLGRTEHRRWCAFHYVMGYRAMPDDVFAERSARFLEEKEKNGRSGFRIDRDTSQRYHACLIPWEELPELSEKTAAVTGVKKDLQKMDIDNVRVILKCMEEEAKAGTEKGSGTAI